MSDITFSMSADEKDVTRALQNLIKENAKLRGEITKGVEEAKSAAAQERQWAKMREQSAQEATQQMQRMAAAAQKVKDGIATPFEKAKKAAGELRAMLEAGVLTTDQYRAAYAKLAKEMKDANRDHAAEAAKAAASREKEAQAARALVKAEREHAQAVRDAAAIAEKYATKEEKVAAELKKLNDLRAKGVLSSKDYARAVAAENAKLEETSQHGTDIHTSWGKAAATFTVATASATALIATLHRMRDASRDAVAAAADKTTEVDTLARQMQIQAGVTDAERNSASRQILAQARTAGVTANTGFRAATQLYSSGFVDPVNSGTLQTILDIQQGTQFQGSPEELIMGFAETLNAYGMERNKENVGKLGTSAAALFKATDLQLTDMQDFAKNASVFRGANMPIEQSLAGFTALREVLPSAEAATGLRNFTTILQGAGSTKASKDALAALGLRPDQVDFVGEDLTKILATMRQSTQGMREEDRNASMIKLFGRENFASASLLLNNQERVAELQGMQQDTGAFAKDVATARGSMQSDRNRLEIDQQMQLLDRAEETNTRDLSFKRRDAALLDERQRAHNKSMWLGAAAEATDMLARPIAELLPDRPAILQGERTMASPELLSESAAERRAREERARQSKIDYFQRMGMPVPASLMAPPEDGGSAPRPQQADVQQQTLEEMRRMRQATEQATAMQRELAAKAADNRHAGVVAGRRAAQLEGAP